MKTKKQCTVCKKILPISEFRTCKTRNGKLKHRHSCRECERKKSRERYQRQKAQPSIEQNDTIRFTNYYRRLKGDKKK